MKSLSREDVQGIFKNTETKKYQKKGEFLYREVGTYNGFAIANPICETIITVVSGKVETIKTAEPGDYIVKNIMIGSSAENYIVPKSTFWRRYDPIEELPLYMEGALWNRAVAKGKIEAFFYRGESFEFLSPWGEKMICLDEDVIASPLDQDGNCNLEDIYRIEAEAFNLTYSEI